MTQLERLKQLDKAVDKNLKSILSENYTTEKHAIKVTIAGETIELVYNADFHEGFKKFIEDQISME